MGAEVENRHEGRRCRVVMLVYPLQGHINPMLQLATILHSKGLSITIAYPLELNPLNPSTHPEFTYLPLKADDRLPLVGPASADRFPDLISLTIALNKVYKDPFEKWVKETMELGDKEGMTIGCIIHDVFLYFAQNVAKCWKIPGICLSTSNVATILSLVAKRGPDELGYNMPIQALPRESLLDDPELQALEVDNAAKQMKDTTEVLEVKTEITIAVTNSTATIFNTMGFIERAAIAKAQKYFPSPIYPIGPFHKYPNIPIKSNSLLNEDQICISWLDQHPPKSVIYVSFGSLASLTEEDLVETAMGLAQSNQPFLWVIRPGSIIGGRDWAEILPCSLKESLEVRGCIVGWAPQKQVLGHSSVGGFWTHCGWNSTIESVCEGVPLICRPFFGDQFLNAKYVSKVWKVGLEMENELRRENVDRVVRELMVSDEGDDSMRKRALDLKDKADLCFKEGGGSSKFVTQLVDLISSSF